MKDSRLIMACLVPYDRMREKAPPFKFELFDLDGRRISATRALFGRYLETDWEKKEKNVKLFQFILPFVHTAIVLSIALRSDFTSVR